MNTLLGTADGRVGVARSTRWSGIAALTATSLAAAAVVRLTADAVPGTGFVIDAALAATAASLAFAADDLSGDTVAATPLGRRTRLGARLLLAAPVVALGWLAVAEVAGVVLDAGRLGFATGVAALALVGALAIDRTGGPSSTPSPGAAAVASTSGVLGLAAVAAPARWLEALPPGDVAWLATVIVAAVAARRLSAEPARR